MVNVSSWGRLGEWPHQLQFLSDRNLVSNQLRQGGAGVAFGMGRSYGDVCLNPGGQLWRTTKLDRFIGFDEQSGILQCEAGVLLGDIQRLFMPRGWMLAVTPGTQMVTVGGAIANDVHGKNHHRMGTFGDHIKRIRLARTDGSTIECGPAQSPEWFFATIGGLGLTGVIVTAEIQLRRVAGPWLVAETLAFGSLKEFLDIADDSHDGWEYTVAWVDCVSSKRVRGLFMRANPDQAGVRVEPRRTAKSMPFVPPISLVGKLTLRPFNAAYFHLKKKNKTPSREYYESFFYPLDGLQHWNRMYGPAGFYQYQCVVPHVLREPAVQAMLDAISRSGEGSFLSVLKTFGERKPAGMLSFPLHGVTLALDFPNRGEATLSLFHTLDAIVREAGGRIYAAKDSRMPRDLFEAGYSRLAEFLPFRDPGVSSSLSRRLMGK